MCPHRQQQPFAEPYDAQDHGFELAAPHLDRHDARRARRRPATISDQDVDTAHRRIGGVGERVNLRQIAQIAHHRPCLDPMARRDVGRCLADRLRVPTAHDQARALRRECLGNAAPQAAAGGQHQGAFVRQSKIHVTSPVAA